MGRHFFERLERWEKGLQVIVVLLFSLLVFFQMFMGKEPIRFYLSFAEQMEGVPLSSQDLAVTSLRQKEVGEVKLKIDSYFILPGAAVYINGKKAAGFQEREVLLPVKAGDEIVLDGTAYPYPITFQVSAVSQGVCWPPVNYRVTTDTSRASLGKVRIE
ncbi:MAG TPA: hypothetical protein GX520_10940 [Syntrophaceticus sp.]|jgi:hypothetical protein|nr:hypothetical protein [Syntrophaceticus schinkii]MDD4260627.1 hypothetical protein [Syntrophaceticus schinkii]MDD4674808.1 hypothetical protein [Syntrophaceticus schinkii]HHY31170.1 hypothetical protein [Syntrophaceticus sp.]